MRQVAFASFVIVAACLASPASAVDPPVVAPGECLYLYGAPPGMPAATTEVSGRGTKIWDVCDTAAFAEVGRDAPHRIHLWAEQDPSLDNLRGCAFEAYSDHAFDIQGATSAWLVLSASGSIAGTIQAETTSVLAKVGFILELQAVAIAPEGEVILARTTVLEHSVGGVRARRSVDERWSASVTALVPAPISIKARLVMRVDIATLYREVDLGAPGTGHGVEYSMLQACVVPVASPASVSDIGGMELEEQLYEKRCLPSIWLPAVQGGGLEAAMDRVFLRTEQADATGDRGANIVMARDRMTRAASEYSQGQFQRACRSTSDALRALTTP